LARPGQGLRPDALQRVLVRVQSDLEGGLGLASLAAEARLSRAHFQRAFTASTGESPSAFVSRVRVERAAFLLCITEATALEIGLGVGFRNADTFTRAFRRQLGCTPRDFRRRGSFAAPLADAPRRQEAAVGGWALSPTRVLRIRRVPVAFLRHVGPYEDVDSSLWVRLVAWARRRGIARGVCIGIAHDAPGVTRPERLRFDAGIAVGDAVRPADGVGVQHMGPCAFAVTTHVGPYSTLPAAYGEVLARCRSLDRHRLVGLPSVEIYRDVSVDPGRRMSTTDICLPVERMPWRGD
jgi:AraC family transcriptional regulator